MAEAAFAEASSGAPLDNPFMTAIDQLQPAALGGHSPHFCDARAA